MKLKKIELSELSAKIDPIVAMRDKWFLVTAEDGGKANTLTVFIRPQRHTKKFMDASGRFTATFFDGHQQELLYLGSHSGAEEPDKIDHARLHLTHVNGQPTFAEGKLVLICRTLYRQALEPDCFLDKAVMEAAYPDKDYSVTYVAEVEAAYEMEE